jgi:hypothetical protein
MKLAESSHPENPIHRPPAPTPNQSASDVSPTILRQTGATRPSSATTTFRRTVNVKSIANNNDHIFTQNGVL